MNRTALATLLTGSAFSLAACGTSSSPTHGSTAASSTTAAAQPSASTSAGPATTVNLGTNPPGTPAADEANACHVWTGQLRDQVQAALQAQDLAPLIRLEMGQPAAAAGSVDPSAPWLTISADAADAGGSFANDFKTLDQAVIDGTPDNLDPIQAAFDTFSKDCAN